ncbi:trypsin-like peptidase domain-containing protein [Colwellia demingiae]|uniref:Trypsin-like peptidase domain-containing protein n=1 Tax=Colwellia demingiae TaxID=89401 RepID=A0A5C6Q7P7_9GAMM|nr:serine protease [Colwellia demingiae]TWX64781.1 trypsin-like peptidase domain-containing protein [Colwellia demingiae]
MKAFFTLVFILLSSTTFATEQAEEIFAQLTPSLYQIKLIDKASGEKSSIGSGFQISSDGIIATNYHVISSYARHPEKYRIEYLDHQGKMAEVDLVSVDVINDLALVKRQVDGEMPYFMLSDQKPTKGEKLFALGNPHDLGMIVVPGTYNGLKKESFNERIHFTGSINSGMSGGPVVNKSEKVVGINVATSGNQIGFLVPHDKLVKLFNDYNKEAPTDIKQQMAEQLLANQNKLMKALLNNTWQNKELAGKAMIPIIEVPFIRCWGDSNADKSDALILAAIANCSLDENTYLSSHFFTGSVEIEFRYMQAKNLSDNKFYHLYQQQIARAGAGNRAGKNDVSEYQCHHDVVTPSSTANTDKTINNKSIFCTRAYKEFPGLFDVLYLGASVDKNQQALVSHFTIAGVSQENAMAFTSKFMEAVSWK